MDEGECKRVLSARECQSGQMPGLGRAGWGWVLGMWRDGWGRTWVRGGWEASWVLGRGLGQRVGESLG